MGVRVRILVMTLVSLRKTVLFQLLLKPLHPDARMIVLEKAFGAPRQPNSNNDEASRSINEGAMKLEAL